MTFSWQLLGDCNLRLAGFKGVLGLQWAHPETPLTPAAAQVFFPEALPG